MAVKGLLSLLAEGMSPENLKRIGMLTDESAQNPAAVKTAQTKYKKLYEGNDQFRSREEQTMLNPQVVQRGLLDDRRIIMPEDIENTVLVPHKGDISGTDVTLTNIGGFELPVPVTSRGGARYPNSPLTPEGNYWASMKTGAVPFQNKAEGLMESLKMDATGVYTAMGREANYFNQAFADGMLQWAQSMKLPKEAIKKFDDDLRKSKPDWVGLNSPEARDQLLGMGNFKPEGAGKFRSAFTKTMSKSAYRDLGFPTIVDIEKAFIDPDLAGTALGEAGFTMGRVGKGFDLNRNTNHPSYNTGIGGEYIGGFEQSVPPQIMYPDAYKQLEGVMTKPKSDKPPRLLYDAEKIDAIAKRQDLFQVADARWVDTASKWLEDNKGASNAALIAAVGLPATMATQEAEAAPTGLLRNVFPAPQRMFDPADKAYKPFLESFGQTPGGRYLEMGPEGPKDITGEYPASAALGVGPDGKPKFQVAPEQATNIPEPKGPGRKIKTNLAKKKTGWKWTQAPEGYDPNPDGGFPIVSVNDGKDHYYTLNTDFPEGVELARYPNEASEPRLKPTRKGHVNLGQKVGEIEMRGKKHPVYDNITIRQAAPVAMTGLLGAGMSEESDASLAKLAARGLEVTDIIDPEDSRVGEYFLSQPDSTKSLGVLRTDYAVDSGFDEGYMASQLTEIAPEYRRQGLARELYDAAEELSGNKLVPSTHLSVDGAHMWNARDAELLRQVQDKMVDENYERVEGILNPEGRPSPNAVKLRGFDGAYAVPAAGLLAASETAEPREYREAPVVQEQSFGDMVNEYANINQRAQAAEAQKFDALMREDARLRDMGSASFGQVSPELAAYRRSQILPTIGEMGMGALEGAVDTADFVSQLPTAISTMTMPKRTPLRDRLGGLLDYSFVDERDQRARDEARLIGGLLSPI
jgi:hypothetical protein